MTATGRFVAEGDISPCRCPLCEARNDCPLASGHLYRGTCWCASMEVPVELLQRVPEAARRLSCICRRCVEDALRCRPLPKPGAGDYYLDSTTGRMVFTEQYHRRRGYCCGSGCRHCPWIPDRKTNGQSGLLSWLACVVFLWFGPHVPFQLQAGNWSEDFSTLPSTNVWVMAGNPSLFHWDSVAGNLKVRWDTSQAQSFFVHPLGQVLTSHDDFAFSLDLELEEVQAGLRPNRPGAMPISMGWLNSSRAFTENYARAGGSARELLEWDWFPAGEIPGFGRVDPTLSPIAFDSDANVTAQFTYPFSLDTHVVYHLSARFQGASRKLAIAVTADGMPTVPVTGLDLPDSFGDFHLDAFGVFVWNESSGGFDSLFAEGTVDNIVLSIPEVANLQIRMADGSRDTVQFVGQTGWSYFLEGSMDLKTWNAVSLPVQGTGQNLQLTDVVGDSVPVYFYRVQARHPGCF